MGWNCPACGYLLKPETEMTTKEREVGFIGPRGRVCSCPNCRAKYLILEGHQPRIYLESVVICFDDGEEK